MGVNGVVDGVFEVDPVWRCASMVLSGSEGNGCLGWVGGGVGIMGRHWMLIRLWSEIAVDST